MTQARPGIVVVGAPRSGTTLLRRVLDAHTNIACPPETYLLSAAARFLHEEKFAHGLQIGVTAGLGFAGFEEDEVLRRLREFAFGFLQDHASRQGKPRWAEKTAFDAFHLEKIRRVVGGHVKFLCVQRHGLDVACSLAELVDKTGGYVEELHAYLRRYPAPLEAFARAWVDTSTAVHTLAQDDPNAIVIRYEDFAKDPEAELRRVLEFIDEPYEAGLVERALTRADNVGFGDWKTYSRTRIDTSSIGRWRKLPPATIQHVAEICNPTLTKLGYDAVENTAPAAGTDEAEAARRRYELGLLVNRMKSKQAPGEDPPPDGSPTSDE